VKKLGYIRSKIPRFTALFWIFVFGLCCCCQKGVAEENAKVSQHKNPRAEHLSASHTEGKGQGYSKGYSSLDLFLSQPFSNRTLVPFLDLRGHIFNDGKYAANAGAGFRMLSECRKLVWGVNAVYDYLQKSQRVYNQVGGGVEVLGERFDARINFYVPVGGKRKNIYRFEYDDFSDFGLTAREQFALKGIDSLFGYRFCKKSFGEVRVGAGPYYYWGKSSKTTNAFNATHRHSFGGRVAAGISFWDYLMLEGVGSYDTIFRWCGQARIVLNLPFDFTWKLKRGKSQCKESSYCLRKRLYEPLLRNEIIAVKSLNRFTDDPRVLDPEFKP
jgi:hypothetical protein